MWKDLQNNCRVKATYENSQRHYTTKKCSEPYHCTGLHLSHLSSSVQVRCWSQEPSTSPWTYCEQSGRQHQRWRRWKTLRWLASVKTKQLTYVYVHMCAYMVCVCTYVCMYGMCMKNHTAHEPTTHMYLCIIYHVWMYVCMYVCVWRTMQPTSPQPACIYLCTI